MKQTTVMMQRIVALVLLSSFLFCCLVGGHGFGTFGKLEVYIIQELFLQDQEFLTLGALLLLIPFAGQTFLVVSVIHPNKMKSLNLALIGLLILCDCTIPLFILTIRVYPLASISYLPFFAISILSLIIYYRSKKIWVKSQLNNESYSLK